ncbi:hypothetical protein [Zunongwangia sp.]|uniref:hypothetical protein n=1 Tax=Zunongwangia sp. TaxID=1965325 RepID=UPI003AA80B2E
MFLKYISFFILFVNGYGQLNAYNALSDRNDTLCENTSVNSENRAFDADTLGSDASIGKKTDSHRESKFYESEEAEIEEAQNESDSPEFLSGNLANLFYSYLTLCHPSFQTKEIPFHSNKYIRSSYPSFLVRFCVFRI